MSKEDYFGKYFMFEEEAELWLVAGRGLVLCRQKP